MLDRRFHQASFRFSFPNQECRQVPLFFQMPRNRSPTIRRPSFRFERRPEVHDRERFAESEIVQRLFRDSTVDFSFRQIEREAAADDPERFQKLEISLDDMFGVRQDADVIEKTASLPRFRTVETDPVSCSGNPSGKGAFQKTLGIDRQVRGKSQQPSPELQDRSRRQHPTFFDDHQPVDPTMSAQKAGTVFLNQPGDLCMGITNPKSGQNRPSVNDIARRPEPDNQNSSGRPKRIRGRFFGKHHGPAGKNKNRRGKTKFQWSEKDSFHFYRQSLLVFLSFLNDVSKLEKSLDSAARFFEPRPSVRHFERSEKSHPRRKSRSSGPHARVRFLRALRFSRNDVFLKNAIFATLYGLQRF